MTGQVAASQPGEQNVLPPGREHEPTAHQQPASDAIADDAVLPLGANEGQAEVAGTDPPSYLHC
jgi:hypothetical protein